MREMSTDILVVGAGNAALCAALSASGAGLEVMVVESADRENRGGNTAFTGGVFRHWHNGKDDIMRLVDDLNDNEWNQIDVSPFKPEALYNEVMHVTSGKADPDLTRTWVYSSRETIFWMKDNLGIKFTFNDVFTLKDLGIKKYAGPAVLMTEGKGKGLSDSLFRICENRNDISIIYETAMHKLLVSENKVEGIECLTGGEKTTIMAKAVILAGGGFEASREMRKKLMGPEWESAKVRGSRHNTGEPLFSAIEAGCAKSGDFSDAHCTPIDARSPGFGDPKLTDKTARYSWMYGILVNLHGKRFVDEGEDLGGVVYAKLGKIILRQQGSTAVQIFDRKSKNLLEKRYSTMEPQFIGKVTDVATGMGIPTDELVNTIRNYNSACSDEYGKFKPGELDGLSTRDIIPPKSNWATPISPDDVIAYAVTGGITFTFGGLRVGTKAEVMGKEDKPVNGLYAAGEITGGFFFGNYPVGSGLMRGSVFGRIAGNESKKYVKKIN